MIENRLISFNKKLSAPFIKYIDTTSDLCIYKLGSHTVPKSIFFPKAKTLTLINCSKSGITNILNPNFFPNLSKINYLSAHPGNYYIYTKFKPELEWNFPDKNYDFYNFMIKSGNGKKDPTIIKKYITNKKIIDGKNGFDISFQFDLNIPGYGITNGEWYQMQFYEYLVKKHYDELTPVVVQSDKETINQEIEEVSLQKEYVKDSIESIYFNEVLQNDN